MKTGIGNAKTSQLIRLALSLVLAALLGTGALGLTGCGDNTAQVIRDGISGELDQLKDPASSDRQSLSAELNSSFGSSGLNVEELMNAWLADFDYTVGDFTVQSGFDWVEVPVTITARQLMPSLEAWVADQQARYTAEELASLSAEDQVASFNRLIETVTASKPVTTEITITATKTGANGAWEIPGTGLSGYLEPLLMGASSTS